MIYTLTLNPALDREYAVPAICFDTVLRSPACRVDYGGKGFNVSRAILGLGGSSVALGFVAGWTGRMLAEGLAELGIPAEFVWGGGETRTNVSIVEAGHSRYIKVNEPGCVMSDRDQHALMDLVRSLAGPGDWWVLAGSLPPGAHDALYGEVISLIRAAGGFSILDSSGAALRAGCEAGVTIVKPNQFEAEQLTGKRLDSVEKLPGVLQAIHDLGPQMVVLSLGKQGAVLSDRAQAWHLSPPSITERNPIGAGDALVAGLVKSLADGEAPVAALRWGVACGAATASLDGTAVGSLEQVARLHALVTVAPL